MNGFRPKSARKVSRLRHSNFSGLTCSETKAVWPARSVVLTRFMESGSSSTIRGANGKERLTGGAQALQPAHQGQERNGQITECPTRGDGKSLDDPAFEPEVVNHGMVPGGK